MSRDYVYLDFPVVATSKLLTWFWWNMNMTLKRIAIFQTFVAYKVTSGRAYWVTGCQKLDLLQGMPLLFWLPMLICWFNVYMPLQKGVYIYINHVYIYICVYIGEWVSCLKFVLIFQPIIWSIGLSLGRGTKLPPATHHGCLDDKPSSSNLPYIFGSSGVDPCGIYWLAWELASNI